MSAPTGTAIPSTSGALSELGRSVGQLTGQVGKLAATWEGLKAALPTEQVLEMDAALYEIGRNLKTGTAGVTRAKTDLEALGGTVRLTNFQLLGLYQAHTRSINAMRISRQEWMSLIRVLDKEFGALAPQVAGQMEQIGQQFPLFYKALQRAHTMTRQELRATQFAAMWKMGYEGAAEYNKVLETLGENTLGVARRNQDLRNNFMATSNRMREMGKVVADMDWGIVSKLREEAVAFPDRSAILQMSRILTRLELYGLGMKRTLLEFDPKRQEQLFTTLLKTAVGVGIVKEGWRAMDLTTGGAMEALKGVVKNWLKVPATAGFDPLKVLQGVLETGTLAGATNVLNREMATPDLKDIINPQTWKNFRKTLEALFAPSDEALFLDRYIANIQRGVTRGRAIPPPVPGRKPGWWQEEEAIRDRYGMPEMSLFFQQGQLGLFRAPEYLGPQGGTDVENLLRTVGAQLKRIPALEVQPEPGDIMKGMPSGFLPWKPPKVDIWGAPQHALSFFKELTEIHLPSFDKEMARLERTIQKMNLGGFTMEEIFEKTFSMATYQRMNSVRDILEDMQKQVPITPQTYEMWENFQQMIDQVDISLLEMRNRWREYHYEMNQFYIAVARSRAEFIIQYQQAKGGPVPVMREQLGVLREQARLEQQMNEARAAHWKEWGLTEQQRQQSLELARQARLTREILIPLQDIEITYGRINELMDIQVGILGSQLHASQALGGPLEQQLAYARQGIALSWQQMQADQARANDIARVVGTDSPLYLAQMQKVWGDWATWIDQQFTPIEIFFQRGRDQIDLWRSNLEAVKTAVEEIGAPMGTMAALSKAQVDLSYQDWLNRKGQAEETAKLVQSLGQNPLTSPVVWDQIKAQNQAYASMIQSLHSFHRTYLDLFREMELNLPAGTYATAPAGKPAFGQVMGSAYYQGRGLLDMLTGRLLPLAAQGGGEGTYQELMAPYAAKAGQLAGIPFDPRLFGMERSPMAQIMYGAMQGQAASWQWPQNMLPAYNQPAPPPVPQGGRGQGQGGVWIGRQQVGTVQVILDPQTFGPYVQKQAQQTNNRRAPGPWVGR